MLTYGVIGKEGNKFYNRLVELLAEKKNLINSICMRIGGSRRVFQTNSVGSVQSVEPVISESTSQI